MTLVFSKGLSSELVRHMPYPVLVLEHFSCTFHLLKFKSCIENRVDLHKLTSDKAS